MFQWPEETCTGTWGRLTGPGKRRGRSTEDLPTPGRGLHPAGAPLSPVGNISYFHSHEVGTDGGTSQGQSMLKGWRPSRSGRWKDLSEQNTSHSEPQGGCPWAQTGRWFAALLPCCGCHADKRSHHVQNLSRWMLITHHQCCICQRSKEK